MLLIPTALRTHAVPILSANQFMIWNEIIAVGSKSMKQENRLCEKKTEFSNLTADGTHTYHWALNKPHTNERQQ